MAPEAGCASEGVDVGHLTSEIYYDPYDFEIDADPYPVWKRLRDEAPLYRNEKYGFVALSRFDDVERCSADWKTYISGKGSVLEMIANEIEIPPGSILFEDPPASGADVRWLKGSGDLSGAGGGLCERGGRRGPSDQ